MTKFVVIGEARAGTTWLADLIRHHPQAACLMEPLAKYEERLIHHHYYWPNSDDVWIRTGKWVRTKEGELVRGTYKDIGAYFDKWIWTIPKQAQGAKLLSYYFFQYSRLGQYLRDVDELHVIRIERNPLRVAMSDWYANKLCNWNVEELRLVKARQPFNMSWDYLKRRLQQHDKNHQLMDYYFEGRPICRVHYHDLLENVNSSMDAVSRLLGIEPQDKYTTTFQRMTPQSFDELVLNHKALRKNTPKRWQKYWERNKS